MRRMMFKKMTEGLSHWTTAELSESAQQLGNDGKEGKTYLQTLTRRFGGRVLDHNVSAHSSVAIKTFKKTKSPNTLLKEARFQQMAAVHGAAPPVYGVNTKEKYIVMQALANQPVHKYRGKSLPEDLQYMICALMGRLDNANVMQGDMNALNVMTDSSGRPYIIDFGFGKKIDKKLRRKRGEHPNISVTLWGLVRGFRHRRVSVDILDQCVSAADPTPFFERGEVALASFTKTRKRKR